MTLEYLLMDRFDYLERFGRWQWLKTPVVGISASEFGALVMQIDWMHAIPAAALAITAFGTAFLGLLRYYRLNKIEEWKIRSIAEAEVEAVRRGRAQIILPTPDPDRPPRTGASSS